MACEARVRKEDGTEVFSVVPNALGSMQTALREANFALWRKT